MGNHRDGANTNTEFILLVWSYQSKLSDSGGVYGRIGDYNLQFPSPSHSFPSVITGGVLSDMLH